jgi:hypothetical protein
MLTPVDNRLDPSSGIIATYPFLNGFPPKEKLSCLLKGTTMKDSALMVEIKLVGKHKMILNNIAFSP